MLANRAGLAVLPSRREIARLIAAAGVLVLAMTAILGVDLTPRLDLKAGDLVLGIRATVALLGVVDRVLGQPQRVAT